MGLIFTTRGWSGGSIEVTHPVHGMDAYSIDGDQNNAYDVATALAAWMLDVNRDWYPDLTAVTWTVEVYGSGRNVFLFTPTGTTFSGFGAVDAASERIALAFEPEFGDGDGDMRGSCSAIPGTVMWDRRDTERGTRTRAGSFRMGHGLYSHRSPSVEVPMDLAQAYAFNEAIQIAAVPRTAYVYDEQSDTWRFVTVGRHTLAPHTDTDVTKVVATLDVLGGL